jgi:hypothetical protein
MVSVQVPEVKSKKPPVPPILLRVFIGAALGAALGAA